MNGNARKGLLIVAALATLALGACSSDSSKEDLAYVERPVESLYNEAMDTLQRRNYTQAAKLFDEVERQHPYSAWATKAQLMSAYCYYQSNSYQDAILSAERFIQLHPGNKDAPYAYYLIAVSHYEQISDVGRDQRNTELALNALDELVRRYPDTQYARDARLKIDLTRDHLAGKEMEIGRYYLRQGQYLAAISRFKVVVDKYQTTSQVPEALHRLVEAYLALGVKDEAQSAAAVLGANYPGSPWYEDSYAMMGGDMAPGAVAKPNFVDRTFSAIF
ncbi:outer membrane protein assembly factor BamD [Zavarzinia sp. CC-PAN008]|uniref:outer membrane protein assembly factor BamD n=1 Tax=Zavarzinia sp. CC-PAN008 TaxID=3243332 RepID=UPI003F745475